MSKQAHNHQVTGVSQNDHPTLRVFVAFEDLNTRMEAWNLYRHLAEDLARDLDLTSAFCNFEVLGADEHDLETMKAAEEADLIFFSMTAGSRLSPGLKSWIETWVSKRRGEDGGLFLLIEYADCPGDSSSPAHLYLRDVANRVGMDFLAQTVPVSTPGVLVSNKQTASWNSSGSRGSVTRMPARLDAESVS